MNSSSLKTPILSKEAPLEEDWFDNVENLKPLRGGRRADTLNEIASGSLRTSSENAEKKFHEDFNAASKSEDPLGILWNYANWFEEHFPTGKNCVFYPILYKICTTYAVMEKYKNDERMMKLWVKLAESFPESGLAVMEFAYTKGSCRELAKFYLCWSKMYQAIGHLHRAKEKLELGIAMFAIPLPLLHKAIDELNTLIDFQTSLKNVEEEEQLNFDLNNVENCRETLGKLRGLGRCHIAPIIRITQGPPGKVLSSAQKSAQKPISFDVFVDQSPAPTVTQKIIVSGTPAVRRRLIDDLKDDPDYQALFGFFDDREKIDLQFNTVENSIKTSNKRTFASASKLKSGKLKCLPRLPQPIFDFEVYSEETEELMLQKEEHNALSESQIKINDKPKKSLIKSKLKLRRCFVVDMSVEEGYALRLYPKL